MLKIRPSQNAVFEQLALQKFVVEMVGSLTASAPAYAAVLGAAGVRAVAERGIELGRKHGFTLRGPLRTFLQISMLLGCDFATDPQYPWAMEILAAAEPSDEMARAVQLFEAFAAYDRCIGGHGHPPLAVLHAVLARGAGKTPTGGEELDDHLISEAEAIYPGKCVYLGRARLHGFISGIRRAAAARGDISPQVAALSAKTAFLFGHGYANDPRLPWFSHASTPERSDQAAVTAHREEKFAEFVKGLLASA